MVNFSIILPTYNRASFLPKAINSVLNQQYDNWELIIIDDGSKDNTKNVVSEFALKDNRIKYIYQNNAERSAARNNGIQHAKGEYICFLDSDDVYYPDNLKLWNEYLTHHKKPVCMNYCNFAVSDLSNNSVDYTKKLPDTSYISILTNPIIPNRVCIHKDILAVFKFDKDISIGEDVCLWLKIKQNYTIKYSSHVGGEYAIHETNSVNIANDAALKMYKSLKLFLKNNPSIKKELNKKILNEYYSRILTNISHYYKHKGNKIKAVYYLVRAIFKSFNKQTKYRIYQILSILKGS